MIFTDELVVCDSSWRGYYCIVCTLHMWKFFTEETQVAMAAHYEDKLKRALYKGFSISKDKEQV